ncbi:hypothetical protein OTU49_003341, partial [Cherax quadricarinatus]
MLNKHTTTMARVTLTWTLLTCLTTLASGDATGVDDSSAFTGVDDSSAFTGVDDSSAFTGVERSDCPFTLLEDQCVLVVNFQKKTHDEAQSLCRGLGGDLATIKTDKQLKNIFNYILVSGDTANNTYWVDGKRDSSNGIFHYSSGERVPMDSSLWGDFRIKNKHREDGQCMELSGDEMLYMNDMKCNKQSYSICEFSFSTDYVSPDDEDDERSDCSYVQVGDQCLFFINFQNDTRDEAQSLCRGLGGNLVAIHTATQMKNILNYILMKGDTSYTYWMDGTRDSSNGVFRYSTGEEVPSGTPFWSATRSKHEPTGDGFCIELFRDEMYYMNDHDCDRQCFSVCEFSSSTVYEVQKDQKEVVCETPFTLVGDMCLSLVTHQESTWQEAEVVCNLLGGDLASINDIENLRSIYLYLHGVG